MPVEIEARLTELGIVLPAPPAPGSNYVSARTIGHLVFLAGVISADSDRVIAGTAGFDRTIEEGYAAARACALIQLVALRKHLGSLDSVESIVSVNGYVNAVPGFPDSPRSSTEHPISWLNYSGIPAATCVPPSASPRFPATFWSNCK